MDACRKIHRKGVTVMELIDRLREVMKKEFGIETDADLLEAVKNQPELDLGIFVTPLKVGVDNAS
nr:MAG TPA: hypothetical protein [Caudoviricetes sp.]